MLTSLCEFNVFSLIKIYRDFNIFFLFSVFRLDVNASITREILDSSCIKQEQTTLHLNYQPMILLTLTNLKNLEKVIDMTHKF